nr:hypothetical protein [Tanacetum cinerariifolium]
MCICLKDHLDAKERKQDKSPLEIPLDFEADVFDDEVQRNEAIPISDEEIALDASSKGTRLEIPVDFKEEILNSKVQQKEAIPLFDEEITLDAAINEGTMSGSGLGGEKINGDIRVVQNIAILEPN